MQLKNIFTARDSMEAHFVRQVLAEHGIEAAVMGESLETGRGGLPMTPETLPSVWVSEPDEPAAMGIIEQAHRVSDERPDAGPAWTCPGCGELLEPQFAQCWKCQTDRPE